MVFKKVGEDLPPIWQPENDGDSIEGILKQAKSDIGKNKSMLYTIEVDGELKSVWGSKVLDDKMLHVAVGDLIKITYGGYNDPDKEDYKKFTVEKDTPEEDSKEESEE